MRVLLTRPRPDSEETARLLAAQNIETVIAPLIEISDIPGAAPDLEDVQALLVTSANGARALARATARRDLPLFAVGDASAAAAAESGFSKVTSANGDVAALAAVVRDQLSPENGALFHAAGSVVAGDLAGDLTAAGFEVRRAQLYSAQTAGRLPEVARRALNDSAVDAALFYSPRTAAQFAKLVESAGLAANCQHLIAVCLSATVAETLTSLPFYGVRVAATANQAALFAALTRDN
ncbi:MAG: uroporphyrinogen-III synthase [Alphaproteobacteria bacterium]|nr:uroporphyrinogen-III synthase [Alphaproteobacteria bacterium]